MALDVAHNLPYTLLKFSWASEISFELALLLPAGAAHPSLGQSAQRHSVLFSSSSVPWPSRPLSLCPTAGRIVGTRERPPTTNQRLAPPVGTSASPAVAAGRQHRTACRPPPLTRAELESKSSRPAGGGTAEAMLDGTSAPGGYTTRRRRTCLCCLRRRRGSH